MHFLTRLKLLMIDLQGTLSSSHSSLPRMFGASWLMSQRASTLGSFISSGNMGSSNCPKFLLYQYYTSIVSWFSDMILETLKYSKKPFHCVLKERIWQLFLQILTRLNLLVNHLQGRRRRWLQLRRQSQAAIQLSSHLYQLFSAQYLPTVVHWSP